MSSRPHVVQDLIIGGLGCPSRPGLLAGRRSPCFVSRPDQNWARGQSNTYLVDRICWRASRLAGSESIPSRPAGPDSVAFLPWNNVSRPVSQAGRKCGKGTGLLRARLLKTRSPVPTLPGLNSAAFLRWNNVSRPQLGLAAGRALPYESIPSHVPGWAECRKGTAYCVRGSLRQGVPSRPAGLNSAAFLRWNNVSRRPRHPGWRQAEPCPTNQSRPVSQAGRNAEKAPLTACAAP